MPTTWTDPLNVQAEPIQLESISTLSEDMVYRLPGCDGLMIRKALQRYFMKFCDLSTALRSTAEITVSGQTRRYTIQTPSSSIIDCVLAVYKKDTEEPIRQKTDYVIVDGPATSIIFSEGFIANGSVVVCCDCILRPEVGSEQCPRWFLKKYGTAITSGAMYELFSMSGRRWSDSKKASDELLDFQNAVTSARCRFAGSNQGSCSTGEVDCFNRGGIL